MDVVFAASTEILDLIDVFADFLRYATRSTKTKEEFVARIKIGAGDKHVVSLSEVVGVDPFRLTVETVGDDCLVQTGQEGAARSIN